MFPRRINKKLRKVINKTDTFLESLGLMEKEDDENYPLAELRDVSEGFLDFALDIDAKETAKIIKKHTGLKPEYLREDKCKYWTFTIPRRGYVTVEEYKGHSHYMTVKHVPSAR